MRASFTSRTALNTHANLSVDGTVYRNPISDISGEYFPIADMKKNTIPMVVITQSDGAILLNILDTNRENVEARLDAESDVDGEGQEDFLLPGQYTGTDRLSSLLPVLITYTYINGSINVVLMLRCES